MGPNMEDGGVDRTFIYRECVRILDLRVQVHPGEIWVSKQRLHIVSEASKSAVAKDDVPKICGLVLSDYPYYLYCPVKIFCNYWLKGCVIDK